MAAYILLSLLVAAATGAQVDQRPVSKVQTLLKDMVGQLQKEAEEDEKVKEQMDCWCETGRNEKETAINDAEILIGQLTSEISSTFATSGQLNTELKQLNKEIAKNTEALDKSTTLRGQQMKDFNADETGMISSIGSMGGAIEAIASQHEGSFEKANQHHRTGVHGAFLQKSKNWAEAIQAAMLKHPKLVSSYDRQVVTEFAAAQKNPALLQQGAKYSPAHSSSSGEIFGVLQGMKESFEKDLKGTQEDESRQQGDFEALKKAKNNELSAAQNLVDSKSTQLGSTDQRHAEAKQELKDTRKTLAADSDYLANLKEQCKNVDAEYAERTSTRLQEITAVSKALAYLSSDDANDLYARTFNSAASFFQQRITSASRAPVKANQNAAMTDKKANTFDTIKGAIQDVIDKLVTEKEDAMKHKDFCFEEIRENERMTEVKGRAKLNQEAKIGELKAQIEKLARELAEANTEISNLRVMLKRAGEDREKANAEFQSTVADQRATRALLEGARGILQSFYSKGALVQTSSHKSSQPAGAPPPAGFKKNTNKSGGVMGMIQQIIDDAKAMEAEAIKGEEEGQIAFEKLVAETNESTIALQKSVAHKSQLKAGASGEKAQTEIELENTIEQLSELSSANRDLHADCDYALKTFDDKQNARDDEIMALKESIPIFSGAAR